MHLVADGQLSPLGVFAVGVICATAAGLVGCVVAIAVSLIVHRGGAEGFSPPFSQGLAGEDRTPRLCPRGATGSTLGGPVQDGARSVSNDRPPAGVSGCESRRGHNSHRGASDTGWDSPVSERGELATTENAAPRAPRQTMGLHRCGSGALPSPWRDRGPACPRPTQRHAGDC